jgi:hypothetical protein
MGDIQRALWGEAGDAVQADPTGTAPRLYVESLNEMIDSHTTGSRPCAIASRAPW